MSTFTLSAIAEEDLIQIYVVGATSFGLDQAHRYHQKLFQVFHSWRKTLRLRPYERN